MQKAERRDADILFSAMQPCVDGVHLLNLGLLNLVSDAIVISIDELLVVQLTPNGATYLSHSFLPLQSL